MNTTEVVSTDLSSESAETPTVPEQSIRERAYELYRERGDGDGRDQEDWLAAESELLANMLKQRAS